MLKRPDVQKAMQSVIASCKAGKTYRSVLEEICESCSVKSLWQKRLVKDVTLLREHDASGAVSETRKLQRYYGGNIFLYYKSNVPNAIEIETYRNRVIAGLLDADSSIDIETPQWNCVDGREKYYRGEPTVLNAGSVEIYFYQDAVRFRYTDDKMEVSDSSLIPPSYPTDEKDIAVSIERIKNELRRIKSLIDTNDAQITPATVSVASVSESTRL
ncbi:MAG: hypothetical protein HQM09_24005 [Candidatus Riflebacteria bacterium]|nr:hypothetical protein [Candidatus Riflebacteria bacterium]